MQPEVNSVNMGAFSVNGFSSLQQFHTHSLSADILRAVCHRL